MRLEREDQGHRKTARMANLSNNPYRMRQQTPNNTYPRNADSIVYSPHTLPANALYLAHLAPSLREQKAALDSQLQTAQSENARLLDSVLQQRREIETLVGSFETVIADVNAANAVLPSEDMIALTEDAVMLDSDLRMKG